MDRREFLKFAGITVGAAVLGGTRAASAQEHFEGWPNRYGALFDTTLCVGCGKCEWACNQANRLPAAPLEEFEDKSVFEEQRRPHAEAYTVVNRYVHPEGGQPIYRKVQCMHCDEPACASACLVGAFKKTKEGAVLYDENVCIGCRYCVTACPFHVPAYEYDDPFSPAVRKCTFCSDRISKPGGIPACVEICPEEAIAFGKRSDLITLAHQRIVTNPGRYIDHIFGENEVGGMGWMYLAGVPFGKLGFPSELGATPYPQLTRGFLSTVPVVLVVWPALLMGCYALIKRRERVAEEATENLRVDDDGKRGDGHVE